MKKYKSQSQIKPLELDQVSSPTTVYENYNIVESIENTELGEITIFNYDVNEYEKQEYHNLYFENYLLDLDYRQTLTELGV